MIKVDEKEYSSLADAVKVAGEAAKKKNKAPVTVVLGLGTIELNSKVTLPNGVHIVGAGAETIVSATGINGTVFASNSKRDTALKDFCLNVQTAKQRDGSKVVTVAAGKSLELENVTIHTDQSEFSKVGISVEGNASIRNCNLEGVSVVFEKGSAGKVDDSVITLADEVEEESAGFSYFGEEITVSGCTISNFNIGMMLHGSQAVVKSTSISSVMVGVDIDAQDVLLEANCEISASSGRAIKARQNTKSTIKETKLHNSNIGVTMEDSSHMEMMDCTFEEIKLVGMRVENKAELNMKNTKVEGGSGGEMDAITVTEGGVVDLSGCSLKGISGRAIVIQGQGSRMTFENLDISECSRCILVAGGGHVTGSKGMIQASEGVALHLNDSGSYCSLSDITLNGGNTGILIKQGATGDFEKVKIQNTKKKGVDVSDGTATFTKSNVFVLGTVAVNIRKGGQVHMNSCNMRRASEAGLKIVGASSSVNLVNCGFLQNEVGIIADAAKTNVDGCTFVESQKKSIEVMNMKLVKSTREGNLNKEAAIKLRWCNYIEPRLQGEDISNDMGLLNAVTTESAFYGAFDYEYRMYCQTLMERMRQAKKFYESQEPGNDELAIAIMNSVRHIYKLIPEVKKLLLVMLADIPKLGMFCFAFKMGDDHEGLYTIDELVSSWDNLPRTMTYDEALDSLADSFRLKVIDEETFDEQRDRVEEWQRANFVGSKYNRRRDYLLATAISDPLRCWYFLNKEEKAKLRTEILKFLIAPDKTQEAVENQTEHHFHGSWVGQWAVHKLGKKFADKEGAPNREKNKRLFKAWCDAMLDKKKPREVTRAYTNVKNKDDEDKLLLYEAFKMISDRDTDNNVNALFPGKTLKDICGIAASLFTGEGVLPGYFRRAIQGESNPEKVLDFLANVPFKGYRKTIVIATMAQFYLPDDVKEPKVEDKGNNSENYDSCPLCFVQKLFPWNEVKIKNCVHNHRFCLDCANQSLSQGSPNLWGLCPIEVGTSGDVCGAEATRRDMELCGVETEKIYNILEKGITSRLNNIEDWKACNVPGCIGGRSHVKLKYYRCRLCENMVTLDGGESDPTIEIKLLQGLDVNEAKRGNGVYRECYHCASSYEKGNACSTLSCPVCKKVFSMSYGNTKINHVFEETGIQAQHYVPKKEGTLWRLGVFKDKRGRPLKLGALLNDAEVQEVLRRAKLKLREYLE